MNILMLTQKVDKEDSILGFTHSWIDRLSQRIDNLYIITEFLGKTMLSRNVKIYSLGEETGSNKLFEFISFNRHMACLVFSKKIDIIFCHMCPEFVIAASPYAKLMGIPMVMWYAHEMTGMKVRIAHFLTDTIITSSKEGFRLRSNKLSIIGHGIDTELFKPNYALKDEIRNGRKMILSVGRLSPIKNYETLIEAADILVNKSGIKDLEFQIIGDIGRRGQEWYLAKLKNMVGRYNLHDFFEFVGPIPHFKIARYYQACDIFVSTSQTGSLDKAALEAIACGKLVLASNDAFLELLKDYRDILFFEKFNKDDLADKISNILKVDKERRKNMSISLRNIILENHNLNELITQLLKICCKLKDKNSNF